MDFISLALNALYLVVFYKCTLILCNYYVNWQQYKDFPTPRSSSLLGDSLMLARMTESERMPWLISLMDKFKQGLFVIWLGFKPAIFVFKPEYLEVILPSTVNIKKGKAYNLLRPWLGNALLTSTGKQWFHDRKLIGPTFHFSILEKFAVIFSEKTEILIKCLEREIEKHPGEAIDIFPFTINVALDIICETAMGINVHAQEVTTEYCVDLKRITTLNMERFYRPWYWSDWIFYLTPMGKEYKKLLNKLHTFTKEVIKKKKTARLLEPGHGETTNEESENDTDRRKRKAFLDLLLDQNEMDDAPLSDDELRAQVDTFMFEGHDTTAVAITWALFCLGNNLEHQEKVHEELKEVFKDSQAPVSLKELSQLKYLDRVLKESLRLFPSVPTISRTLVEDIKLGDYNISKGTILTMSILLINRNNEVWPDPLKFDPDRFLPENSKHRNPYAYVPFSAGPRNCVGQKFALLEEKTVLTAILRKWRVKSLKTLTSVKLTGSMILRPDEKIFIHFTSKK